MKNNKMIIKTKRLNIYPLSDTEIQQLIDNCSDEQLANAYREMLNDCINNPEQRMWYAPWTFEMKEGNIRIGNAGFKGPATNHSVEIGYGIDKEYEGQGFTTEAVKALADWAADNEDVLFVEAEADINNAASIHILEKLGFRKYGQGEEGPRFVKTKQENYYTSLGVCLGLCFGISMGMILFDNMTTGMGVGLAIGVSLGAAKDKKTKETIARMEKEKYNLNTDDEVTG